MNEQNNHTLDTSAHDQLFEEYVQALRRAVDEARAAHNAAVNEKMRQGLSAKAAKAEAEKELGLLCTYPLIIAVFRHYFLACEKLNRDEHVDGFQYPHIFALERLMGKHDDLSDILTELPYYPVGIDERDEWV